ncbi:hypothetical protein [Pseudomonas umsongensis]|uniref:hypothetical protein n=1 Tax=Pseudomonas umsongensis TaxID=198618 RepID=UPI003F8D6C72
MQFVDSKSDFGVQLADLLTSGLRRCLKKELNDNLRVAAFLGRLKGKRGQIYFRGKAGKRGQIYFPANRNKSVPFVVVLPFCHLSVFFLVGYLLALSYI